MGGEAVLQRMVGDWVLGKFKWGVCGSYREISRRLLGDRFETQERSAGIL